MALSENKQRMARGELYHAFTPELNAERARCRDACARFNNAGHVSRRKHTELFREYVLSCQTTLLPLCANLTNPIQHNPRQDPAAASVCHPRRRRQTV